MAYCPPETRRNPEGSETRYENEEEIVLHDDFEARLGSKSLNEKEVANLQDHLETYFKVSTLSEEETDLLHLAYKSQSKRFFEEIRAQSNVLFEKNVLQDKSKLLREWKMLTEVMKAFHDKFGSKHMYVYYFDFLSPNTNLLFESKCSYEVKSVVENRVSIRPYPIDRNNANRKEAWSAIYPISMSAIYSIYTTIEDSCQSSTKGSRYTANDNSCQSSTQGSRYTTNDYICQSSTDGSRHTTTEDSCQTLTFGSTYTTIDDTCPSLDALQDDKETMDILECSCSSIEFKEDVTNNTRLKTQYYPTRHKTTEQDGTIDANESGTRSLRKVQRADNKENFIGIYLSFYPSKVNVQQNLDPERASLPGGFKKENIPVRFIIVCHKQTPLGHPFLVALVKQEKYRTTMKNKENNQSMFGITEKLSRLLSPKCDSLTSTEFSLSDGSEILAVGPEEWTQLVQIHYKSMESSKKNAPEYLKTFYKKLSGAKKTHTPLTIEMLRTAATLAGGDIAAMFCEGSNSEPQTITYVLTFPDDCRMAISVPTIRGSFLHEKDGLDRADFSQHFNSL